MTTIDKLIATYTGCDIDLRTLAAEAPRRAGPNCCGAPATAWSAPKTNSGNIPNSTRYRDEDGRQRGS